MLTPSPSPDIRPQMTSFRQIPDRTERWAFTLIELVVVLAICAILMGLLLAGIQRARSAAIRAKCANNLRQIGLALQQFHDTNSVFPPGCTVPAKGQTFDYLGWQPRLLPYIEQESLWSATESAYKINPDPFQRPPHPGATVVNVFVCPADDRITNSMVVTGVLVAFTSYLGVSGADMNTPAGVFFGDSRIGINDILDGTSNTAVVGERPPSADLALGWWYSGVGQDSRGSLDMVLGVRELRSPLGLPSMQVCPPGPYHFVPGTVKDLCSAFHFWSLHPGGAHFLFADGAVHFLKYSADSILPQLATRAGGENVELPD